MSNKLNVTFFLIFFLCTFLACSNNSQDTSNEKSNKANTSQTEVYIKNISAASLYQPLSEKGFSIDKQLGDHVMFVDCDKTTAISSEHVRISGDAPEKIVEIRASFTNTSTTKTDEAAKQFLGFIATLPYENAAPDQARSWIEGNISKNAKTTINGVNFEMFANLKNIRTLLITPVK
ncbi:hypothetical protein [Pinibacter aurantiacus]|uniref:Uncharacterized protein n=1 Tax=Pinibacter aurantiacus TaxID=2851599 RepID=A0A9E2SBE2_9BACT|nr:hypothetical protein [Pinibacter aurantiacus]MBV4357365.1 hypothetical protein [Pinibacter aurantiacus]